MCFSSVEGNNFYLPDVGILWMTARSYSSLNFCQKLAYHLPFHPISLDTQQASKKCLLNKHISILFVCNCLLLRMLLNWLHKQAKYNLTIFKIRLANFLFLRFKEYRWEFKRFFPCSKRSSSISLYTHQAELFQTSFCVTKYFQVATKHSKVHKVSVTLEDSWGHGVENDQCLHHIHIHFSTYQIPQL